MSETKHEPPTLPSDTLVDRRTFLRIGVSVASGLVAACADDGGEGGDELGESGSGESSSSESEDESSSGESSTSESSTSESSDSESSDSESSDSETTGDDTGDECEGTLLEFDPEAVPLDEQLFPLALMAGEMRPSSVMLAVYVEDAQPKRVRVWRPGPAAGTIDLIAELDVVPSAAGYAKLSVEGLCPGTWYSYAYFAGDEPFTARSRIAEFRTAIAEDSLEPIVVAASACNGSSFEWPALDRTAEEYYDLFLHLGDMAYNDGSTTLAEYRASWKEYLGAEGFKSVYAMSGLYATWDDHEITDNSDFDRETNDPADLAKKKNALDAYFELLPIDAEGPDYRLWRSFRWGLTAEFIVLDCRYERKPSIGEYMTQAQMDWLKQTLQASPCHFKVILNSVPITNMPFLWDIAAGDRWEGFPNSRNELLSFIDQNQIDNVWFISGDFHVCFVSRLKPMGNALSARMREIAMTGGNSNILGDTLGLSANFDYGVGSPRGCIMTFDPATDSVNVRFINEDGSDDFNQDLTQG